MDIRNKDRRSESGLKMEIKLLPGHAQPDCIDAMVVPMYMVVEMVAEGFKNDRKGLWLLKERWRWRGWERER